MVVKKRIDAALFDPDVAQTPLCEQLYIRTIGLLQARRMALRT